MACFRRFAAVAALIAFAAAPVLADWCAANCGTDRDAGMPACHHAMPASASTALLGHEPVPCGHDHHPIVVDVSVKPFVPRTVVAVQAAFGGPPPGGLTADHGNVDARGPAPLPRLRLALSSTLRV